MDALHSKDSKGVFNKFNEVSLVTKTENSYTEFREALNKAKNQPCIPYPGVFLQDLTFTDDGNKTIHPDKPGVFFFFVYLLYLIFIFILLVILLIK